MSNEKIATSQPFILKDTKGNKKVIIRDVWLRREPATKTRVAVHQYNIFNSGGGYIMIGNRYLCDNGKTATPIESNEIRFVCELIKKYNKYSEERYFADMALWLKAEKLNYADFSASGDLQGNCYYMFAIVGKRVTSYCEGDVCTAIYDSEETARYNFDAHVACFKEQF